MKNSKHYIKVIKKAYEKVEKAHIKEISARTEAEAQVLNMVKLYMDELTDNEQVDVSSFNIAVKPIYQDFKEAKLYKVLYLTIEKQPVLSVSAKIEYKDALVCVLSELGGGDVFSEKASYLALNYSELSAAVKLTIELRLLEN